MKKETLKRSAAAAAVLLVALIGYAVHAPASFDLVQYLPVVHSDEFPCARGVAWIGLRLSGNNRITPAEVRDFFDTDCYHGGSHVRPENRLRYAMISDFSAHNRQRALDLVADGYCEWREWVFIYNEPDWGAWGSAGIDVPEAVQGAAWYRDNMPGCKFIGPNVVNLIGSTWITDFIIKWRQEYGDAPLPWDRYFAIHWYGNINNPRFSPQAFLDAACDRLAEAGEDCEDWQFLVSEWGQGRHGDPMLDICRVATFWQLHNIPHFAFTTYAWHGPLPHGGQHDPLHSWLKKSATGLNPQELQETGWGFVDSADNTCGNLAEQLPGVSTPNQTRRIEAYP